MDRFLKSADDLLQQGEEHNNTTSTAMINHVMKRLDILAKGIESTLINRITTVPALDRTTFKKVGLCAAPSMLASFTRVSRQRLQQTIYIAMVWSYTNKKQSFLSILRTWLSFAMFGYNFAMT